MGAGGLGSLFSARLFFFLACLLPLYRGVLELLSDGLGAGDELDGKTGQLLISRGTILAVTANNQLNPVAWVCDYQVAVRWDGKAAGSGF